MKQFISLCLVTTSIITLQAQNVKFGKFTSEELSKKESTITKTAPAEVLYSSAKYLIDWNQNTGELEKKMIVSYRVKVFDKDNTPDNFLTIEIPLSKSEGSSTRENLISIKASTFNQEGGSLKEHKVAKKDIFQKNIHNYLDTQTFTFPNVQNGSILEFSYEIISPFTNSTSTWYFQENIPVVKSDLIFETNEVLRYQDDFRGQYAITPKKETRDEKFAYKVGGFSSGERTFGGAPVPNSTEVAEYKIESKTYTAENLVGYEKEAYVLNPRNLLSSVRFELASYHPKNNTPQQFTTTWERIGKDLIDNKYFGGELSGNNFLDAKVAELTANKTTDEEKMLAIFNFVKDNYKWDDYQSLYTDKGIKKTFNEKTGNSADINLMLTSMLQKANIDANPVVLSTVQNGLINYIFPSKSKLNYVITHVNIAGKEFLMDATEPYSNINMLPIRALNQRGFIVNKNGIKEIDLENTVMSTSKEQITAVLDTDGTISGMYNNHNDNYFYMNNKDEIMTNAKEFEKDFSKNYTFEVENFKSLDNNQGMIRNSFKFSDVKADVINNKIILNPLLFTATLNHNLNYDTRNYNLEFGAPMTISKSIKIKIPEGYKVESLSNNYQEKMVNDAAGYLYKIEESDGFIVINSIRVLPYSTLPADYYSHFKNFMNKIVEAENQNIVLVKI